MKRANLQELTSGVLDVLVVGGGIVGCGIARDAALRGLQVGLIEREDFGAGTTSRSTRLIHGGLRYLELLDFGLVRQDMREREILIRIAPHLVRPLPFLVPMYGWPAWKRDRLRVGMVLYDLLSYDKSLPRHSFLSPRGDARGRASAQPARPPGAARYYDCQVELPERLALANAIDAAEHGALVRTYTDVVRFIREGGRVVGVEARDIATDRRVNVRASVVVNATGPWLDRSLAGGRRRPAAPLLRTTKGVHLVMPKTTSSAILSIAATDGRVFFIVPWYGYSLVGHDRHRLQRRSDARRTPSCQTSPTCCARRPRRSLRSAARRSTTAWRASGRWCEGGRERERRLPQARHPRSREARRPGRPDLGARRQDHRVPRDRRGGDGSGDGAARAAQRASHGVLAAAGRRRIAGRGPEDAPATRAEHGPDRRADRTI